MQTRFIASQRYYGSYHCRNQSIQESRYLLPLFLLFLSSSPRSPSSLTVTRWETNRNGVSSSQLPLTTSSSVLLRPQLIPKRRGVLGTSLLAYRSQLQWQQQTGTPEAEGRHWRPKKNDKDRNTLTPSIRLRVHNFQAGVSRVCGGCQPIKLELCWRTRFPAEPGCACTADVSGYIKGVEERIQSFGLGLAKV